MTVFKSLLFTLMVTVLKGHAIEGKDWPKASCLRQMGQGHDPSGYYPRDTEGLGGGGLWGQRQQLGLQSTARVAEGPKSR